ncbi:FkbM family methyltransferase [bacterium]|nr:FkbM family methyltransferase [bacterium]
MVRNLFFLVVVLFSSLCAKYYSETGQDAYVFEHFFVGQQDGFFVDIGANTGIVGSNSYFFEKLGWKGICFDADPRVFEELDKNRNCKKYFCAVGSREGIENFIQHPGTTLVSGLDRTYGQAHRVCWGVEKGKAEKHFIPVQVVTLNRILEENHVKIIDFLSIDTEGAEKDILFSIDYDKFYFRVMCIENKYEDNDIPKFLEEKGFKKVIKLHRDDIYVNMREL